MIDHIAIPVRDVTVSKNFYSQGLAPLGYQITFEELSPETNELVEVGLGVTSGFGFFVLVKTDSAITPIHLAFRSAKRSLVDAFYQAAMAAGGRDNGKPALCLEYHAHYYGGFVLDPDGHNIEAVCHDPEPS